MTLCALYGRFSPRPLANECESIDTQFRDLREAAIARGWELAGEFSDPDAKGDDDDPNNAGQEKKRWGWFN